MQRDLNNQARPGRAPSRYVGIDLGAETVKAVELERSDGRWRWVRRARIEHGKDPGPALQSLLRDWNWGSVTNAAVCGRLARQINLPRVPLQQAQARGFRFLIADGPATLVAIGGHGFSTLEFRANGQEIFRENNRCSQGTGNFLRQLVERFSLTVEQASELCADIEKPAALSGRCPVILKTDMTHLANKGENRAEILAGLFDALCENVLNLVKPGVSPGPVVLAGGVSCSRRVRNTFRRILANHGYELKWLDDDGLYLEAIGAALIAAEEGADEPETGTGSTPSWSRSEAANPPPAPPEEGSPDLPIPSWEGRGVGPVRDPRRRAGARVPELERLIAGRDGAALEQLPSLAQYLPRVRRMAKRPWAGVNGSHRPVILGFDIGSTGSKVVALDAETGEILWEGYRQTPGDPVGAAQALLREFVSGPAGRCPVAAWARPAADARSSARC